MTVAQKKEAITILRMSFEDKAKLNEICLRLNCTMSEFIRTAVAEKIESEAILNGIDL